MLSGALNMLTSCTASHPLKEFTLENTLNVKREDETLILTRTQLNPTDNTLQPVITNELGEYIPCQLDDLNGDGEWDELAFVHTLAPSEKVKLKILWTEPKEYPLFTPRTNVRYGKMTTPGVVEELAKDMHDNSFGFGGLAMQTPDSLIRMGVPASLAEDVIDSTFYELVTEGPVRSIIRFKYEGWQINNNKINLCEEISIWAGKYGYEKKIQTSPPATRLFSGEWYRQQPEHPAFYRGRIPREATCHNDS